MLGLQSTTEVDYKVQQVQRLEIRQTWITNCDRVWIIKCDKKFTRWITKCDGITNLDGLQTDRYSTMSGS